MPAIRTVSDIKANLLRPALTSHFEVEVPIPPSPNFRTALGVNQDKLNLMCSDATLPGSNLATIDVNNDFTGVTEKIAHRRVFDDRIDLTFYVDAGNYTPIIFFESWMEFIANGRFPGASMRDNARDLSSGSYYYRMQYPDGSGSGLGGYRATGLKVRKFERDHHQQPGLLEYEFVKSYPLAINSMPVSYDTSSLLKCTVSMSYIRYVLRSSAQFANSSYNPAGPMNPFQQAEYNAGGLNGLIGNLADVAVTSITGNRFLGDLAGAIVPNLL
tara:strand:+ start:24 stop:839 length:816 start_codon:yes stop_codon:yes gene_type:complete